MHEHLRPNGDAPFLTIREMMMEIRADVKELKVEVVRLAALHPTAEDHETRIRSLERWKYGIPISGVVAILGILTSFVFGPAK